MLRHTIHHAALPLLLLGAAVVLLTASAYGQATQWQPGSEYVQPEDAYVAQQPAPVPAPAPKPAAPAPKPVPAPEATDISELSSEPISEDPMVRLASMPNMFGDSPFGVGSRVFPFSGLPSSYSSSVPGAPATGVIQRVKIAENNKALPMDRVFFDYNHFENALEAGSAIAPSRSIDLDQYTFGIEKTFRDGLWSVDFRVPMSGAYNYEAPDVSGGTHHWGNLSLTFKRLLFSTDNFAFGGGLGVGLPTGSEVRGSVGATDYVVKNDACHLLPYVGFLAQPTERVFVQGFLQVDVATLGNGVQFDNVGLGRYNDQTLMYLDLQFGYWLYRNENASFLTGLAGVMEFHYTGTLQDTDVVSGDNGVDFVTIGNMYNRVDSTNMTIGLWGKIGELSTLGVAGAVPLCNNHNRQFDGEIQIFFNRNF
jgi:hypothetical protein